MNETEIERMSVALLGNGISYQRMLADAAVQTARTMSAIEGQLGRMDQSWRNASGPSSGISSFLAVGSQVAMIGMGITQAFGIVSSAVRSTMGWGFSLAKDTEQATIAFGVMLGSEEKAADMIKNIRDFAAATPMETNQLIKAAKTLMQFGTAGENVMPILKMLGDVTGGDSARFSQLSLAFGQMSAAGRLMGQDLLQMINAGFNPLMEISRTTGKSMGELKKQMEKGGISTAMVIQAFQSATAAGGQFGGMMEKQSQSIGGLWSTFNDNMGMIFQQLNEKLMGAIDYKGWLAMTVEFLGTFSENFEANWNALAARVEIIWNGLKTVVSGIMSEFSVNFGSFFKFTGEGFVQVGQHIEGFLLHLPENFQKLVVFVAQVTGAINESFSIAFGAMLDTFGTTLTEMGNLGSSFLKKLKASFYDPTAAQGMMEAFAQDLLDSKDVIENALKKGAKTMTKEVMNPFEDIESPEFNFRTTGMDLPDFAWETGNDTKDKFNTAITGLSDPMVNEINKAKKAMTGVDAVSARSAAAMQRIFAFKEATTFNKATPMVAAAPAMASVDDSEEKFRRIGQEYVKDTEEQAKQSELLARIASATEEQLGKEAIELAPAGLGS